MPTGGLPEPFIRYAGSFGGNLEVEITIDDPKAYTAPRTVKIIQP
jgi:hypothetical protein